MKEEYHLYCLVHGVVAVNMKEFNESMINSGHGIAKKGSNAERAYLMATINDWKKSPNLNEFQKKLIESHDITSNQQDNVGEQYVL